MMATEKPLKLHLGCGEKRLDGYVNIDFPLEEHSVQRVSKADLAADLRTLRYPAGSVAEVRLHHVFEHFPRPQAVALAACWASWLGPEGRLHIEVPDFDRTALAALLPWSSRHAKGVAIRHLFGSHEAHWAAHWEGWHRASLKSLLRALGFRDIRFLRQSWRGIHNIEVTAQGGDALSKTEASARCRAFLRDYLVDESESELRLLEVWMGMFQDQIEAGWGS
jgi:hypothetical protein